jgi:vacuolar-type H+-ATPase subunit H
MTAITITDATIAKLEAAGFNRWTKGRYDRLYIDAKSYGVEYTYYKSGKVEGGTFGGERFGALEARNFASTKVYIDLTDGTLHIDTRTDFEDEIRAAVESIIAEATKVEDEATDDATDTRSEMIEAIRAQAEHERTALRPRLVAQMGEDKADAMLAEYTAKIDRICAYVEDAPAEWVIAHVGCTLAQLVTSINNALAC